MDRSIFENNQVSVVGTITSDFRFSHEVYGEGFYIVDVEVSRLSNYKDCVPVMVSECMMNVRENHIGDAVRVHGQFRSFNRHEDGKNRLVLSVFVRDVEFLDDANGGYCCNSIYLDGYICKEPVYRKTPLGREITDLLVAVNRSYGKSDYIPCICWGRNARYVSGLDVGTHVFVCGRIQSREYKKRISDTEYETRTAYEVSVSKIELVEEE